MSRERRKRAGTSCSQAAVLAFSVLLTGLATNASAVPLITNGGFEDGLSGWSVSAIVSDGELQRHDGWGYWQDYDNPYAPWYDQPSGIQPAGGDSMASFYADGPALSLLYQDFTVSELNSHTIIAFDLYTDVVGATDLGPCGLDRTAASGCDDGNYFWPGPVFRADLLTGDADLYSVDPLEVFSLVEGDGGYSFPAGSDPADPFVHLEFDVSDFVAGGGDFSLRFTAFYAEFTHVDEVSVEMAPIPEPSAALAFAGGLLVLAVRLRRS